MDTKKHQIPLVKETSRQIDQELLMRQLVEIKDRALSGKRERQGWVSASRIFISKKETDSGWLYSSVFKLSRNGRRVPEETESRQFDYIKHVIVGPAANARGWEIEGAPKKEYAEVAPKTEKKDEVDFFENIYGREHQIKRIQCAIDTAVTSNFQQRNHCLCFGDPSGGKTQLLLAFMQRLGGERAVMRLDATSMTQAGAEEEIIQCANLPRFLIIEEIEKTIPENLRWLIPVLDDRGEIIKTTARVNIRKPAKLLCMATVNDMKLFKKVLKGALASRFPNKIFCPYPDRPTLEKILGSKITKLNGRTEWIAPTLDYCDANGIRDVREIIAICMDGKDGLIDGSYLAALEATKGPSLKDEEPEERESASDLINRLAAALKK